MRAAEGHGVHGDVGMMGPYGGVLGREAGPAVVRFIDGMPRRFEVATENVRISGAMIEISASMARAEKIELLTVRRSVRDALLVLRAS